jgi:hypothetical protein
MEIAEVSEGTANHGDKETLRFSQTQGSRGSQSLRMIPVLSITAIFALIISVAPCLRSDPSPP